VALALTFFSVPWLFEAAGYFVVAFLLSRIWVVWRVPGAVLDALLTVLIAWGLIIAGQVRSTASSGVRPEFGSLPLVIATAVAVVWVAASIPVMVGSIRAIPDD
jgi:hypothetical protein